jgi:2-(1,2-epoxy-1,2-dihydrophenyl)acetyl-CoA isomerase
MRSSPPGPGAGQARVEALNRVVGRLVRFPSPTIAMVDGVAVGAGMNLALACDLIVASDRARFGEVFAKIGLIPDGGGTYLLARRVGLGRAKELCFTAEVLDAQEAVRIGIVNRVVPAADLERETRALASKIAGGPPRALAAAKVLLDRGVNLDLDTCLAWEAISQGLMMETADHREGLAAFFEKRAPRFIGA